MKKWQIDVPVYLIFFNRPDTFAKVFESVKKAKPSKLFLVCDGAREGRKDDVENIKKCQEIASNIDWECEVYRNYSGENLGCGMRMYSGISWAFEYVDRLIILEDDCVPAQDFYPFCMELLERYKDDNRIYTINAMNHLGIYEDTPNDYFFTGGCCWGWATWKRAWLQTEYEMSFFDDVYSMKCVEKLYPYHSNAIYDGDKKRRVLNDGGRLTAWTYQVGMASALNNQISITPKYNMITNIGITGNGVHTADDIRLVAKKGQKYYNMTTYSLSWPLKHPKYVVEDRMYYELCQKKFKLTLFDEIERIFRILIYADRNYKIKACKKFLCKVGKFFKHS